MKTLVEHIESILEMTESKKPFDNIDRTVVYGDLDDLLDMINDHDYVYARLQTDQFKIFDLAGKFNQEAWDHSGRKRPERVYSVGILLKNGSFRTEGQKLTKNMIEEVTALFSDPYRGTYSEWHRGEDIKDTDMIPLSVQ